MLISEAKISVMYISSHAYFTCECGVYTQLTQKGYGSIIYSGECENCNKSYKLKNNELFEGKNK